MAKDGEPGDGGDDGHGPPKGRPSFRLIEGGGAKDADQKAPFAWLHHSTGMRQIMSLEDILAWKKRVERLTSMPPDEREELLGVIAEAEGRARSRELQIIDITPELEAAALTSEEYLNFLGKIRASEVCLEVRNIPRADLIALGATPATPAAVLEALKAIIAGNIKLRNLDQALASRVAESSEFQLWLKMKRRSLVKYIVIASPVVIAFAVAVTILISRVFPDFYKQMGDEAEVDAGQQK